MDLPKRFRPFEFPIPVFWTDEVEVDREDGKGWVTVSHGGNHETVDSAIANAFRSGVYYLPQYDRVRVSVRVRCIHCSGSGVIRVGGQRSVARRRCPKCKGNPNFSGAHDLGPMQIRLPEQIKVVEGEQVCVVREDCEIDGIPISSGEYKSVDFPEQTFDEGRRQGYIEIVYR